MIKPSDGTRCLGCHGAGSLKLLNRAVFLATGRKKYAVMQCPRCGGTGKHGLRVK